MIRVSLPFTLWVSIMLVAYGLGLITYPIVKLIRRR